jgi:LysM repeat protein
MPHLSILSPFDASAVVTTSSTHGHHRPYGGNVSCDMDVHGVSRGTPVAFNLACDGPQVRGVVESVRPACRSQKLEDGGLAVRISLQRLDADWVDTGLRVLYGHLDPVDVTAGQVVEPGDRLGALGPAVAQHWPDGNAACRTAHSANDDRRGEYHSSCAVHSHLHIEAFSADSVVGRGASLERESRVVTYTVAGAVTGAGGGHPSTLDSESSTDVATGSATQTMTVISPYEVREGDQLGEIAGRFGVSLTALVAANPQLLQPAQVINVPALIYEIRPRDTLHDIASRFGITVAAIAEANQIADANVIRAGQRLLIPRQA